MLLDALVLLCVVLLVAVVITLMLIDALVLLCVALVLPLALRYYPLCCPRS